MSGLEFASIPATVGGAIYMNASADNQKISDCLEEVLFLFEDGKEKIFKKEEIEFGYRFSSFQDLKGVILSAKFSFKRSEKAYLRYKMFLDKRNILYRKITPDDSFADKGYMLGVKIDKKPGVVNCARTGIMSMIDKTKKELNEAKKKKDKKELQRLKMM